MRDPKRIYPLCNELARIWSLYPDLRFGQLMHNIESYMRCVYDKDPFYVEDDEFFLFLKNKMEK